MNNVKKSIGWADFTINPVKGLCPMACPYCYARAMYKRFGWYEAIEWDESCLYAIRKIKKPSRIFVGSTMELFGEWVHKWALESIFSYVKDYPQHTFIFLTKQPQNLIKWSFPKNVWVGVSATDDKMFTEACIHLQQVSVKVKFISLEPLLGHIGEFHCLPLLLKTSVKWIIIGQQTPHNLKTAPNIEWIREIVQSADKAEIPVFLKNNLLPILSLPRLDGLIETGLCSNYGRSLRQEFPLLNYAGREKE